MPAPTCFLQGPPKPVTSTEAALMLRLGTFQHTPFRSGAESLTATVIRQRQREATLQGILLLLSLVQRQ